MTDMHAPSIRTHSRPLSRFQRWAASCVAGIGYLFGLFLVQRTLLSFLLLTGIYGVWLAIYFVIYHVIGRQRAHPGFSAALFCVACASLFIPLPATNVYWLPILPTMTACLLTASKPRLLNLPLAGVLWLGTGLAISFFTQQWDTGTQIILLISFASACGCTATINELAEAHTQLQAYSEQMAELSAVRERNRIAREIHDTLGHSLTLLAVQLETATQLEMRSDARLHDELVAARQIAKSCLADVRHSVENLRPDASAIGQLEEALQQLVAMAQRTSPQTHIALDLEEATLPLGWEQRQTLYRCAQEALTNIRKHARATRVLLRLSTSDELAELTVLDDGQGSVSLPTGIEAPGFGLLGMRERVANLHGTLSVGPAAGGGWRVEATLPLAKQEIAEDATSGSNETRNEARL
jgi:signal transduction histidine kinase